MFTKKELKANLEYIRQKKEAVLNSKEGSDFDYIRNLQTLIKLENATNKRIHSTSKNADE